MAFHTLGCKLNFSETSTIKSRFEDKGYSVLGFDQGADIYVINTCSVTDFADRKCRYEVRRALRFNPEAKIVIIGCYAQLKPDEIRNIPGVDLVLGAAEKFNIIDHLETIGGMPGEARSFAGDINDVTSFISTYSSGYRTRSFLKVQDGCDYKCSFCTIPQARGKSRSDSIRHVLSQASEIAGHGIKEIVLTGINLGDFGTVDGKRGKEDFLDMARALDSVEGIERYRISSIEPNLLSQDIIYFVAKSKKILPHFHIPLQSGSDKILRLMSRRYDTELYRKKISTIRKLLPDAAIGVDVIVGFPGESDEDFKLTHEFLKSVDVSYFHVFTYSERRNTRALVMPQSVPMNIRRERNEALRNLSQIKQSKFYQQHNGDVRPVLFEKSKKDGLMTGWTDNYIKVETTLVNELIGKIRHVQLSTNNSNTMMASIVEEAQLPS